MKPLSEHSVHEKLLFSSFLVLMGVAYLMALTLIYLSTEWNDGKPGVSVHDIVDKYYGNRSGTVLESAIRGPMKAHLSLNQRHHIVAWLKSGAPENGYTSTVRPILENQCTKCHSPASGMGLPDLTSFQAVKKVAKVDTGEAILSLVKVSHIHLFGMGLLFLGVGLVFVRAVMHPWLKGGLILLPFATVFVDIFSWYLTKWDPVYAYTVIAAGTLMGLALAVQILTSLYQMWFGARSA